MSGWAGSDAVAPTIPLIGQGLLVLHKNDPSYDYQILLTSKIFLTTQCDGYPLNLSDGPTLQGITFLNIPSTHGGTNMWGDSKARSTKKKKEKLLGSKEQSTVSTSSCIDADLSAAVQGIL